MMPGLVLSVFIFAAGLCVGSFINVCIYRLPREESIVTPRSHCTRCGNLISFYDNIPVISYIVLAGKCRHCGVKISFQYPLVEILTGSLFSAIYYVYSYSAEFAVYLVLTSALLIVSGIDITHRIIPDEISLGFIPLGILSCFVRELKFIDSLAGILAGGGVLFFIAWAYEKLTGDEGMGGGDIKLLAMIGAFTGIMGTAFTLFIGSLLGSLAGGAMILFGGKGRKYPIPFGVFLSLAALIFIIAGKKLIGLYTGLLTGNY
ncbi:MAG: prepilin peptidase [Candidatus Schekmanbacteria bacterium]|nr:prepilin peptidase [Candidatus Schekmanbacteria bacterium]